MAYEFKLIEEKWQAKWDQDPYYAIDRNTGKPKYYCLDMFPYPSGSGLHIGHWKNYVLSDVTARAKYLQGFNVMHPMGYDSFGLPAENSAIKEGVHPKVLTEKNINTFRGQLKKIGAMFDWSLELSTTDSDYYKWTQWIFIQMFKAGLAYQQMIAVNWCPSCLTGLANEESNGGICERCGATVEQKPLRQWVLKITKYADALAQDIDQLDWPERVKLMQKNWIGKSFGLEINFKSQDRNLDVKVFTTRADTIFGVTFVCLAPEHPLLWTLTTPEQKESVENYVASVANISTLDRQILKDKTGAFTGAYLINPANDTKIPVYTSSYVLTNYGTGAVMGVPAHDERDFEFAKKYNLPIIQVIKEASLQPELYDDSGKLKKAFLENGLMCNSQKFDGIESEKAKEEICQFLIGRQLAEVKFYYKLKDWVFSRQRYWGEPIPVVHCQDCGVVPVDEKDLPVTLPEVERYQPTGTGESPLGAIDWWVNTTCPKCSKAAKRETNTMPQWAGSCWYFLRYADVKNSAQAFSLERMKQWLPVDLYVGGAEHAVLHLLYSRFYVKFLHEAGYLPFNEPFKKLFNQGFVCMYSQKSGRVEKMSKSKGNVVNPDDVVAKYGTDALRTYIMFMGPPEADGVWSDEAIIGAYNFLGRFHSFFSTPENFLPWGESSDAKTKSRVHKFIRDFCSRVENFKTNTAISATMELLNDMNSQKIKLDKELATMILSGFSVFTPHLCAELLESLGLTQLEYCSWPKFDPELVLDKTVTVPVQVNGRLRATIDLELDCPHIIAEEKAREVVEKWLEGSTVKKVVSVPNKLINFVIGN